MSDSKTQEPRAVKKIMMEMLSRIRSRNQDQGAEAIPSSDDIHKRILGDMGVSKEDTNRYLQMLVDSHYLFSFKIVEGNEKMKEKPIFGYVIAEHSIVLSLKENLKRSIEAIYEGQNYKRKPAGEVIKEVLSQGRHNNTPLGKAVNASIMLQQYENLLRESAEDYTETWKIGELNDLLNIHEKADTGAVETNSAAPAPAEEQTEKPAVQESSDVQVDVDLGDFGMENVSDSPAVSRQAASPAAAGGDVPVLETEYQRAVDSPSASELQKMDLTGSWGMAVQKFGVEFLLRIHFRKYEFDTVVNLLKAKKIAKEKDVRYIRDTMRKLELRMSDDPELAKNKSKIESLKRIAQIRLNEIFMANKN